VSGRWRLLVLVLAAALSVPSAARAATLPEPQISNLRIEGATGPWSASNSFKLRWNLDPAAGGGVVGVSHRLLGVAHEPEPRVVDEAPALAEMSHQFNVPVTPRSNRPAPGIYTAEVWARTAEHRGPSAFATLRFDDVPPGPAQPWLDATWFRTDVAPLLRIAHPAEPWPISGIRGYAVSVRRDGPAPPCAGPSLCSVEETDLAAGIDDDEIVLGPLPEGIYVASVVAVSNAGVRSAEARTALVGVDGTRPELSLDGVGAGWSNRPVRVRARATDPLSGMTAAGPTGPRTTIGVDGETPTVAQGEEAVAIVAGSGIHTVLAGARDAAGNARGDDITSPPLTGVVRIDEDPPAVAFTRAADPTDPELLEAVVDDALSGPAAGGSIGVRPRGSDQAFSPLPTRSVDGRLSARWDSDSYPPGGYEFLATGFDAAGNAASSTRRANGAPMALANPVKVPSAVRFGFGGRSLVWHRCVRRGEGRSCRREVIEPFGRRPPTRVVPYGRGVQLGGRVVSAAGESLAGVGVELVETFDPGATATTRITHLRTGADGTFFARLAPGPSRRVEARFGGSHLLTRSSSRSLRLGVQALVRFRASTSRAVVGGRPVVFRGRILRSEATIPSYGRPVQLQFRLPGMAWTEFRTVQTDAAGRFEYPYSFSDDDSRGVRFLFRAYAPPQPGWPYEPATSRPLAVTGS
jgi:hypothetical protein